MTTLLQRRGKPPLQKLIVNVKPIFNYPHPPHPPHPPLRIIVENPFEDLFNVNLNTQSHQLLE